MVFKTLLLGYYKENFTEINGKYPDINKTKLYTISS